MPTRLNKTSIGISFTIKERLFQLGDPKKHNSWDDLLDDIMNRIDKQKKENQEASEDDF